MLDHLYNNPELKDYVRVQFLYRIICTQDREDLYFTGKSRIEDLGSDYQKLCKKANELNKLDGEWGIHHWVAKL